MLLAVIRLAAFTHLMVIVDKSNDESINDESPITLLGRCLSSGKDHIMDSVIALDLIRIYRIHPLIWLDRSCVDRGSWGRSLDHMQYLTSFFTVWTGKFDPTLLLDLLRNLLIVTCIRCYGTGHIHVGFGILVGFLDFQC